MAIKCHQTKSASSSTSLIPTARSILDTLDSDSMASHGDYPYGKILDEPETLLFPRKLLSEPMVALHVMFLTGTFITWRSCTTTWNENVFFKDLVAHDVKLKAAESSPQSFSIPPTNLEEDPQNADDTPLSYGNLTDNSYATIQLTPSSPQPKEPRLADPFLADLEDPQERIDQLRLAFSGITSVKSFYEHKQRNISRLS